MKVFLSSTAQDLDAYRKVAEKTILQLSQQIVAMEYFGALPGTPVEESERLARNSNVVVCIVAYRYGSGITQREVEAAHKASRDVLVWIVADDYPWSEKKETDLLGDPNVFTDAAKTEEVRRSVEALSNFKTWLRKTFTTDSFTTPDDLGRRIAVGVSNYVKGHAAPPVPQDKISIARLPVTGSELFGRESELNLLDNAWANPNTNIVSFVAWGGVGKTALVNHWLKRRMARDNYRGADRVYGWSFFNQGTIERATSADLFIDQALRWFGDNDPTAGSPWDKGERLARYIRQSRTLLVLDGLEPLQHPPGPQEGRLKDAAMQAFLVELAAQQPGLCVITTRERVGDLVEFEDSAVIRHNLEHLSPQAGAQILRSLNVKGEDQELEDAVRELGGHSLSLMLMGSYLDEVLNGDIRRRNEIENLFVDTRYGEAAQRMIVAYEKWLGESMELTILRLLGLFNGPADLNSLVALREPPVIAGLTESLRQFNALEWNQAVAKLRRAKLLAEASADDPGTLDAHPIMREHFKQQLKREHPRAWRQANDRLYQHLRNTTKELPETVEEMTPLYNAVIHGTAAGRHREVFKEVYFRRIQRGATFNQDLGAFGADLAVLSSFFETPWTQPSTKLTDNEGIYLLAQAGSDLRAIGRLQDSIQPTESALQRAIQRQKWGPAATIANNLSQSYLTMGELSKALDVAQKNVELADRSDGELQQVLSRVMLGNAYHQIGQIKESAAAFCDAETRQSQSSQPFAYPILTGFSGYDYCELLVEEKDLDEIERRASQLPNLPKNHPALKLGANYLWAGRVKLSLVELGLADNASDAEKLLDQAVEALRLAAYIEFLPRGLLSRAKLYRLSRNYVRAERDLAELLQIAARSEMRLHLADCHLELARLNYEQRNHGQAREHLRTSKEMIERMGYHRRDKEIAELEQQLGHE